MRTYKSILVAVDGSIESETAFQTAKQMAKDFDATLTIAHVLDLRSYTVLEVYDLTVDQRMKEYGEGLLNKFKQTAVTDGVQHVRTVLEYGSPRIKIPKDIALEAEADLIICGATGLNAVERLLLGSVSEGITRNAKCDVLIVRK